MGNMFCGYACIVYAMRGDFDTAAPFIGFAVVLDMLDGRIARLTGTSSAFGVEFDSLADVISFGVAPAMLSFAWALQPLGRLGWACGGARAARCALVGVGVLACARSRAAPPAHFNPPGGRGGETELLPRNAPPGRPPPPRRHSVGL